MENEFVQLRIQHYFVSKTILLLQLDGLEMEKLRNLALSTNTFFPFGTSQQSFQLAINHVRNVCAKTTTFDATISYLGSVPYTIFQVPKQVDEVLKMTSNIEDSVFGNHMRNKFVASV